MTRICLAAALACLATSALADDTGASAVAAPLPPHVLAQIEELRSHGARFEKAIAAIEAQAALPSWGWDDCGHDTQDAALPAM